MSELPPTTQLFKEILNEKLPRDLVTGGKDYKHEITNSNISIPFKVMLIKVTEHVNVPWGLSTTKRAHNHAHSPEVKGRSAALSAPAASGCTAGAGQS